MAGDGKPGARTKACMVLWETANACQCLYHKDRLLEGEVIAPDLVRACGFTKEDCWGLGVVPKR
jgi:hypothetical protein